MSLVRSCGWDTSFFFPRSGVTNTPRGGVVNCARVKILGIPFRSQRTLGAHPSPLGIGALSSSLVSLAPAFVQRQPPTLKTGSNWPKYAPFTKRSRNIFGRNCFLQILGPTLAKTRPTGTIKGQSQASSGAKRVKMGPKLPSKPSHSICDHFWANPFLTPKMAIWGPVRGAALAARLPPPPSPGAARYGVLRVRLDRSEEWKPPKVH